MAKAGVRARSAPSISHAEDFPFQWKIATDAVETDTHNIYFFAYQEKYEHQVKELIENHRLKGLMTNPYQEKLSAELDYTGIFNFKRFAYSPKSLKIAREDIERYGYYSKVFSMSREFPGDSFRPIEATVVTGNVLKVEYISLDLPQQANTSDIINTPQRSYGCMQSPVNPMDESGYRSLPNTPLLTPSPPSMQNEFNKKFNATRSPGSDSSGSSIGSQVDIYSSNE